MKRRRSTFRSRNATACNASVFGYRALLRGVHTRAERQALEDSLRYASEIGGAAPTPLPGETHRQLAARLSAEKGEATVDCGRRFVDFGTLSAGKPQKAAA